MKKKLLFVIDSLTIGGAEKSLVSLLSLIDSSSYEVDLLQFKKEGDFEKYVPEFVKKLPEPQYFSFLNGQRFSMKKNFLYLNHRLKTSLNLRLFKMKRCTIHNEQIVFNSIERVLLPIKKEYDVAIAYSQGMPTYFVANKVRAAKKLAWINTDYTTTLYDKELDYEFYKKIDKIVTVSNHTRKSVSEMRSEYLDKVDIIFDIINPKMIREMAKEYEVTEYDHSIINILTVGRLVGAKGYDRAIEVAYLLKKSGYKFKWFVIGEGPERSKIKELIIKYHLEDCFILLGKKLNPYPYMSNCELYVQTSLKEGFGLTVSEAKILKRPIVCTTFPTAGEIIENGIDGLIVEHDVQSIFYGITKYLDDHCFKEKIKNKLNWLPPYSSMDQLEKFYQLLET